MPVPTVIAWMLGAAGVAVLAKTVTREWRKVNAALHPEEMRPEPVQRESLPTLRYDPRTGMYRADNRR